MSGQAVSSRQVTVPADGEATVQFNFNIVEPGTYTARVGSETATITVVDPAESTSTATPSTSTQFPGFGVGVALSALALAALFLARRD
ncbi:PGF-CTERM sorting domain-containing protein [Salinigranum sp.]|uniref:PGF-CTERM sorting domain-containing protein n=1 Tax=Salinigranum sp. TaxID=1966351 RepID=UPI00356891B1